MTTIKVHFEDKQGNTNTVTTRINGTPEEISRYYLDKWFNFPDYESKNGTDCYTDHFYRGTQVEIKDDNLRACYIVENVHISEIHAGNTVLHTDGLIRTVCKNNISYNSFMKRCLFGDNYSLGTRPVLRVKFVVPTAKGIAYR